MTATETRINELFEELVPDMGKADTVGGEIVRAVCKVGYRWVNDGDMVGRGYGRETCNPAARYLCAKTNRKVAQAIQKMSETYFEDDYEAELHKMEELVLDYLETYPAIKELPNDEDMYDYADPKEDVDDYDDEDEWR